MKNLIKISLFVLLLNIAAKANASVIETTNNAASYNFTVGTTDTSNDVKSNIIIFKIIATPAAPANNTNGDLKKAGKVIRTSHSHTSIENIANKNRGV